MSCLGLLLVMAHPVHAVTISPVVVDQTLSPGDTVQGNITVINDSNQPQTYYASTQNFIAKGEEGEQTFLNEQTLSGLASWIVLDQSQITLAPNQTRDFKWAIRLPANAEPGGHYSAVFFSTQPAGGSGSSVGVAAKTGVLFLVNVKGDIKEAASIDSFAVMNQSDPTKSTKVSFLDSLPAYFEARVRNTGSVHIAPSGSIEVKNMFGNQVAKVSFNPNKSRVLPDSTRKVRSMWGNSGVPFANNFWTGMKNEWSNFAIGRYTATSLATYGSQNQPLSASVSFWVFPWRLTLALIILLVLLLLMLKGYNKFIINSAMRRSTGANRKA